MKYGGLVALKRAGEGLEGQVIDWLLSSTVRITEVTLIQILLPPHQPYKRRGKGNKPRK